MRRYWIDAAAAVVLAAVACSSALAPAAAQRARAPGAGAPGAAAPAAAPCSGVTPGAPPPAVDIPFAASVDPLLKDPDRPAKKFRVDFASVEHECPLSRAELMKLTPDNIAALSQEHVDQIYGRLTAGPIPDGQYLGKLFFPEGDSLNDRLEEILGGIPGRLAGHALEVVEIVGGRLWKGKVFDRENRLLRNMIEDRPYLYGLVEDRGNVRKAEIRRDGPFGRIFPGDVWLLFAAKVYCGQSLLDSRRESIIIDYAYSDELPEYRASPDSAASRGGIRVRDEIRMVRPGFYLGRAYANRMLLLNFTLFKPDEAKEQEAAFAAGGPLTEQCWPGEQVRKVRQ
jgi:hypothetical protein